ncbi:unnamed protein product [Phyllotreta striolata]|uniref:Cytochrome P450 n=1 Tax=Phyllotreta striolata TaxID=444603 RepID=A0A9P0DUY4_PHYSR|nr:unnamed protein product [Phyllotreta striolata]
MFAWICVVFLLLIFHAYKNRKYYLLSWKLKGPFPLPIIGNGLSFLCENDNLLDKTIEICNKYPSPLRLWFGPKFTLVITDVTQAQKVMSSYNFITKDPDLYKFLEPFDGKGLITSSGVKWRKDRRLISPIFAKKNILQYFPTVLEQTKILINVMESCVDKPAFNIEPYIHRCAADIVNRTFLGVKTEAQFGKMDRFLWLLHRMYTIIYARIVKVWLQNDVLFQFSSYWKEHEEGKTVILGFMDKVIEISDKNNQQSKSFQPVIEQLKSMRDEDAGFCTHQDLKDHLVTLYSASEDTVTSIVSFTLLLLGMHPNIQERVIEEIHTTIGDKNSNIDENNVNKLEYLEMVIKDVLRLFPIASFIVRKAEKEICLYGDCWIPAGCSVIVSIYNIHRDAKHWEKPNQFYPEHFLPDTVRSRHPYAFMPFSAGPRGCIGKPFAYMTMKIMLVTILQHFQIETDEKFSNLQLKTDISIRPKNDRFPIRLLLRK